MFALMKTLLLASLALSASALTVGGHVARSPARHHAVAARHGPPAVRNPILADKPLQRRSSRKVRRRSCRPPTSSAAATTTPVPSSSVVVAPAPAPTAVTTSSSSPVPLTTTSTEAVPQPTTTPKEAPTTTSTTTQQAPTPTTQQAPTTTTQQAPTSTPAPAPTTTSTPPPATTTQQASGGSTGEVFEGDATWFDTGLGACGIDNKPSDRIVAVSQELFDSFPGYKGDNPNANPICKKMIRATFESNSIDVMVVDRCTGCKRNDLDFTTGAFAELSKGGIDGRGRIHWRWLN